MAVSPLSLKDLPPAKLEGRRVLLRLDLNLPLAGQQVTDDFRLQRVLPTIKLLQASKSRILVLSHRSGRQASLRPIVRYLSKWVRANFAPSLETLGAITLGRQSGEVIVLENLRRYSGEENNSLIFAKRLASYGDFFVNEAFSASHRPHASIIGLPELLPGYAGLLFTEEVNRLSSLFASPKPFLVIVGGAKSAKKLPLIRKFLALADQLFVGGALAHPFFRGLGYEIGRSLLESDAAAIEPLLFRHPKIILPVDVVVRNSQGAVVKTLPEIRAADTIVDAGPQTFSQLAPLVQGAKTILWNGPLGNCENGFAKGTASLARLIAESQAESVAGGGDTVAALANLNLLDQFSFVSTGGGAMLEFLATGTLPGIEALKQSQKRPKV